MKNLFNIDFPETCFSRIKYFGILFMIILLTNCSHNDQSPKKSNDTHEINVSHKMEAGNLGDNSSSISSPPVKATYTALPKRSGWSVDLNRTLYSGKYGLTRLGYRSNLVMNTVIGYNFYDYRNMTYINEDKVVSYIQNIGESEDFNIRVLIGSNPNNVAQTVLYLKDLTNNTYSQLPGNIEEKVHLNPPDFQRVFFARSTNTIIFVSFHQDANETATIIGIDALTGTVKWTYTTSSYSNFPDESWGTLINDRFVFAKDKNKTTKVDIYYLDTSTGKSNLLLDDASKYLNTYLNRSKFILKKYDSQIITFDAKTFEASNTFENKYLLFTDDFSLGINDQGQAVNIETGSVKWISKKLFEDIKQGTKLFFSQGERYIVSISTVHNKLTVFSRSTGERVGASDGSFKYLNENYNFSVPFEPLYISEDAKEIVIYTKHYNNSGWPVGDSVTRLKWEVLPPLPVICYKPKFEVQANYPKFFIARFDENEDGPFYYTDSYNQILFSNPECKTSNQKFGCDTDFFSFCNKSPNYSELTKFETRSSGLTNKNQQWNLILTKESKIICEKGSTEDSEYIDIKQSNDNMSIWIRYFGENCNL